MEVCRCFGIPLAEEKTVLPCRVIKFLGITIDTVTMEFRLPFEKVQKMLELIKRMLAVKKTTLRELQSLLGLFWSFWL